MKDLNEILGMASRVQEELQRAQDNLDKLEVEGAAGGGLVKVKASAKGRILGVSIDDSLLAPSEKQMLEDLITAAFNDARKKADEVSNTEMGKMTAGLPLPPGTNSAERRKVEEVISNGRPRRTAPRCGHRRWRRGELRDVQGNVRPTLSSRAGTATQPTACTSSTPTRTTSR